MTQAIAQILDKVEGLSFDEKTELADLLLERLDRDVPPDVAQSQIAEVRRRIAQVDSGEVVVVPGKEALEQVRKIVAAAYQAH